MPSRSSLSSSSSSAHSASSSTSSNATANTGSSTLNHIDTALTALGGDSSLHSAYPFSEQHRARPHPSTLSNAQKSPEALLQTQLGRFAAPGAGLAGLSAAGIHNPLWGNVGALRNPFPTYGQQRSASSKLSTTKTNNNPRSKLYEEKMDKQRLEHIMFSGDQSDPLNQQKERMRQKLKDKQNKKHSKRKNKKQQSLPNGSSSNGLLRLADAKKQKANGDNGGYFVTDITRSASSSSLNSKYRKNAKPSSKPRDRGNSKQRNKKRDKKKPPKARKQSKTAKKKNSKGSNDDAATATSSKPEGSVASACSPRSSKADALSHQLDECNGAFAGVGEKSHSDFVANGDFIDNQNLIFDNDNFEDSNLSTLYQNKMKLEINQNVQGLSLVRDRRELEPLLPSANDDEYHSNYHTNHNPHLGVIANGDDRHHHDHDDDNDRDRDSDNHEDADSDFEDNFDDVNASDNEHEGDVSEKITIYIDPNERKTIREEEFQPGSVQTDEFPDGINSNEDLIKYQKLQQQNDRADRSSSRRNSAVLNSSITAQADGGINVEAEDEEKHIEEPMQNGHAPIFDAKGVTRSNEVQYVAESDEDGDEDLFGNLEINGADDANGHDEKMKTSSSSATENERDGKKKENENEQHEGVEMSDFGHVINKVLQKAQLGANKNHLIPSEEEEREKEAEDLEHEKSVQSNQPSLTEKWCEINTIVGSAPSASADHHNEVDEPDAKVSELDEFLNSIGASFYDNYHAIMMEHGFDVLDKIKSLKLDDLTKKMSVPPEDAKRIMRQVESVKTNNNNTEKKVVEGAKCKDDKKKSDNKKNKKKAKKNSNDGKGAAKKRNYQQAKEEKKNKNKQRKENKKKSKNRSKQKNKQKDRDQSKDNAKEKEPNKGKQADVLSMEGVSDRENEDNVSMDKEEMASPTEQSAEASSSVDAIDKQAAIIEANESEEDEEEDEQPEVEKPEDTKASKRKSVKSPKSQQPLKEEETEKDQSSSNKKKKKKRNKKRKQNNTKRKAQDTESQTGSSSTTQKKDDKETAEHAVSDEDDIVTMDSSSNAPSSIQYQEETNDGWIVKGSKGNKKSAKGRSNKRDKNALSSPSSVNAATPKSTKSAKSSTSKKSFAFEPKTSQKSNNQSNTKKSEKPPKPQQDETKKEAKKKSKKQKEKESVPVSQHKKPPITKSKSTNSAFTENSNESRIVRKRDRKERRRGDRLNRQKSASSADANNNYAPPAVIKIAKTYSRVIQPSMLLPKSAKPSISDPLQKHNFPPLPIKSQTAKTSERKNQPNIHVNLSVLNPPHIPPTSTPSSSLRNDTSPLSVHSDGDALKRSGPSKPPLPRLHHTKKDQHANTMSNHHSSNSPPAMQPSLQHSSQSDDSIIYHKQPSLQTQHSAPLSTSELSTQTSPQLSPHNNFNHADDESHELDEQSHHEMHAQSPHTDSASSPPSQQQQTPQQLPQHTQPATTQPPPAGFAGFPHFPTLIANSNNTATHMAVYVDSNGNLQETPLNLSGANMTTASNTSGSPDEHNNANPAPLPLAAIPGLTALGLNGLLAPPPQPSELGITPTTTLLPTPLGVANVALPPPPPLPALAGLSAVAGAPLPGVAVPGLPNVAMYLPLFTPEQIANIVAVSGNATNNPLQAASSPTNAASSTANAPSTTGTNTTSTGKSTKSTLKPRLPSFVPSKKSQKLEDIKEEDEHEHMDDDHLSSTHRGKDHGKLPDLPMEGKKKKKKHKKEEAEQHEMKQSDDIATSPTDASVVSPHHSSLSSSSSLSPSAPSSLCTSRTPSSRIAHIEPKSQKECLETLQRDLIDDEKEDEWVEIADLDSTLYPATLWCLHTKSFHIDPECSLKKLQESMSSALALSS
eukprot:CAMPEP_0197075982 /NCGR_PEP_ID=MMETSP1384-20130603/211884_1 /TAXON_ID=29189 /ORGANISM="Ammonia sp." /LENGTH=1853 /DNA_ID=CAMNT_0042514831 /DNA_START=491 /DNA_END=6052 /DNA_ORIENTATION=+